MEIFNNMLSTRFYTIGFGASSAASAFSGIDRSVTYLTDYKAHPARWVYYKFRVRIFFWFHRRNFIYKATYLLWYRHGAGLLSLKPKFGFSKNVSLNLVRPAIDCGGPIVEVIGHQPGRSRLSNGLYIATMFSRCQLPRHTVVA